MAELTEVRVPDIGDFSEVPVIEVLVEVGDRIRPEDPIVTLESDKAAMDVPSPVAGRVAGVALSVGELVSEGALILTVEPAGSAEGATPIESARTGASAEPADAAPGRAPDASARGPDTGQAAPIAATAPGQTLDAPVHTAHRAAPIAEAGSGRTPAPPALPAGAAAPAARTGRPRGIGGGARAGAAASPGAGSPSAPTPRFRGPGVGRAGAGGALFRRGDGAGDRRRPGRPVPRHRDRTVRVRPARTPGRAPAAVDAPLKPAPAFGAPAPIAAGAVSLLRLPRPGRRVPGGSPPAGPGTARRPRG